MDYRSEIDGLRAIAVLSVVIFHLNPENLPGGFIGVDVFFVISGFLITSLIKKQMSAGNFEFSDFYIRRIKRLIPLFIAVILFSLVGGYYLFIPLTYKLLSQDVVAANVFLANVKASISGNYFDEQQIRPLLHLWTLSVEEQFYIIFPLLFFILGKKLKVYRIIVFIGLFLISLLIAEYFSLIPKYSTFSYFLLPTRLWELLAGCIIAMLQPEPVRKMNSLFSLIGIGLIILGLTLIDEKSVFPGFITLLPILGSVLIIISGNKGINSIFSNRIFVFIGLISYSMYMWHWPIIIFIKAYFDFKFNIISSFIFIIGLIVISYFSKKYIEDYFRYKKIKSKSRVLLLYYVIPTFLIISFSLFIRSTEGLPFRYNVDEKVNVTSTVKCPELTAGCFITKHQIEKNQVILLGDSHAEHFSNLFKNWFDKEGISLKMFVSGGCDFYSIDSYSNFSCQKIKEEITKELDYTNTIIIAKRFDHVYDQVGFVEEFCDYINLLTSAGHNVILIKQVPKLQNGDFLKRWLQSRRYKNNFIDNDVQIDYRYEEGNTAIYESLKNNKNVYFLDFNSILLSDNELSKYDDKGMPIYFNSNHITAHGAEWIYSKVNNDKNYEWVISLIKQ